jgi:hypothetical protein
MRGNARRRPETGGFVNNPLQRTNRERFVGFVLEKPHPAPLVVISDEPSKRHDSPVPGGADECDQGAKIERFGDDSHLGHGHTRSLQPAALINL